MCASRAISIRLFFSFGMYLGLHFGHQIASKLIHDRFDASKASRDTLTTDFGAPKSLPKALFWSSKSFQNPWQIALRRLQAPHTLKINFGASKTCPTSRKVAWRLQDGFQTDLRFVANTSPKTSAMQFPLYNTHFGYTLHRRLFVDCELMLRVQRSQERVYSSQFVNHIRRFPLETRPLQQKLKTVFER